MPAPHELELKFAVPPESLAHLKDIALIRALKPRRRTSEVSVYFDTDKQKLRRNGVLLRVRRIGGRYIQTIKAAGNRACSSATKGRTRSPASSRISAWPTAPRWRR